MAPAARRMKCWSEQHQALDDMVSVAYEEMRRLAQIGEAFPPGPHHHPIGDDQRTLAEAGEFSPI